MVKRLGTGRTPNTLPEVLIVVIGSWGHGGTSQFQIAATVFTNRSRRPIVAVGPSIARRRGIEVAGVEEVVRISS